MAEDAAAECNVSLRRHACACLMVGTCRTLTPVLFGAVVPEGGSWEPTVTVRLIVCTGVKYRCEWASGYVDMGMDAYECGECRAERAPDCWPGHPHRRTRQRPSATARHYALQSTILQCTKHVHAPARPPLGVQLRARVSLCVPHDERASVCAQKCFVCVIVGCHNTRAPPPTSSAKHRGTAGGALLPGRTVIFAHAEGGTRRDRLWFDLVRRESAHEGCQ